MSTVLIGLLIWVALFTTSATAAAAQKDRIAFTRLAPIRTQLFLSDSDGGNERPLLPLTGVDYDPSFSADGKWIVFTSERAGSADLYRVHPDGSGLERLTDSPNYDDQGAMSPDGKRLAFVSTRDSGWANVWLLEIATHRYRNLTQSTSGNFRPSWSPDGKWIAFTSDRNEPHRRNEPSWELLHFTAVYVIHPDGTGLRRLTGLGEFDYTPSWTPDSQHVMFSQKDKLRSPLQMFSIDIDNDATAPYAVNRTAPKNAEHPTWSPDGTTIAYGKTTKGTFDAVKTITPLFSRNPEFELFGTGTFPAYSPDGKHLLLAGGFGPRNALNIIDTDGSHYSSLFKGPNDASIESPSWSPDGRTIAFSIGTYFSRPVQPAQIALIDTDGSNLRTLTHGDASSGFSSFSPDGKKLVYRVFGKDEQGLRIMNLSNGTVAKLTNAWDNFPAWSPRGDRIAFTGFRSGDFEIYTIRPDGTDLRQLTHDHGNDAHANWSPDGRRIAFASSRTGWKDEGFGSDQSYGEICVMKEDGSDVQQLTDNQYEEATPAWLPPLRAR